MVCVKHSMFVDITVFNIWILDCVTLISIQGHRDARKQKLLCQVSHKFVVDLY